MGSIAGEPRLTWTSACGVITVLPGRARILQVEVGGRPAFWVNGSSADWNIGGERLWVGPESAWFWHRPGTTDLAEHSVPATLDPGSWEVDDSRDGFCSVHQDIALNRRLDNIPFELRLERTWRALPPPAGEEAIAYRTQSALTASGAPGQAFSIWTLAQLPPGGEVMLGAGPAAAPRPHLGQIPEGFVRQLPGMLAFRITGDARWKAGVRPDGLSGRMGYIRPTGDGCIAVIRDFQVDSSSSYCDSPQGEPGSGGDAVQVYNDAGDIGRFGEMEHHSPCVGVGEKLTESFDTVVAVLRGDGWEDRVSRMMSR